MSLVLLAERRPPVLQDGKVFVSDQQDLMKKLCQSEVEEERGGGPRHTAGNKANS